MATPAAVRWPVHDIVLASMPFNVCVMPPIGICSLKTVLDRAGVRAKVRHFNLEFLPFIDDNIDRAQEIHDEISYLWDFLPGEWLFAETSAAGDRQFLHDLRAKAGVRPAIVDELARLKALAPVYIERCADRLAADMPRIVGFTSSFMQNQPSLAAARALRKRLPKTAIVFGGSNAFGDMGRALIEQYGVIDVVARGESETIIVPMVRALLAGDGAALGQLPGISYRHDGAIVHTAEPSTQIAIDDVPVPDFSDYFATLERLRRHHPGGRSLPHFLPIETSRGCWWGERSHCTFCGLNADRMNFRSRGTDAAFDYIVEVQRRYGVSRLFAVDNIIDQKYYDTVLERLARLDTEFFIHYEIKSNLKRRHVDQLARAGVHKVQPGIESLSTAVLKRMRKGVSALQNIQTLKWLTEAGIGTSWYLLYGFPGEDIESYREMARLLPKLTHIVPPGELAPVYLERFSPYQSDPKAFGIDVSGPTEWYRHAFPEVAGAMLGRLAYRFDFTEPARDPALDALMHGEMRPLVKAWKARFAAAGPTLHVAHGPEESVLVLGPLEDPERLLRVDGALRAALLAFDGVRPERDLAPEADVCPDATLTVAAADYASLLLRHAARCDGRALGLGLDAPAALDLLERNGLLVREHGAALALPIVCGAARLRALLASETAAAYA